MAMAISNAPSFVVIYLTLVSTAMATDNGVITSLIHAYSTEGAESTQSYFSSHGKAMFEQVINN